MLFSVEQAFVGREEIRAPLKTPAWEAIPERTLVKNSYKRSRASLPSPPLLFIAFFTSHRSPLSERLEQATRAIKIPPLLFPCFMFH